jgi:1,5-anhydro-D-fructose reductase (1,5-anhydro-D-mannitol-forming)
MTVNVGILGMGFMGNCHFNAYGTNEGARVAALCDSDATRLEADAAVAGNIASGAPRKQLSDVKTYTDAARLLADPDVDVVDIALPTYLHAEYAIRALQAGKHVICEKPMAICSADAKKMAAVAKKARRRLFVAQCIRFWPSYATAREVIRSRKYGRVRSAVFTRLSATPTWSWNQWLHNPRKSGSAALDLHIHDSDFILYAFGKPKSVFSRGCGSQQKGFAHIVTTYDYGGTSLIAAEGAWEYAPTFQFSMTFRVAMEKATLELAADGNLRLHDIDGTSAVVPVVAGDGYSHELRHFIDCIANRRATTIVPPDSAVQSVRLIEAEIQSATTGKPVKIRL